jgi:hypothetical protein
MTSARSAPGARQTRKWVRTILIANLVLLAALIGPGSSHKLYLAERRLRVAYVIDYSLQFWFVASTVFATVLFVRMVVSKSDISETQRPTTLDWVLFLTWFCMVAIVCLFAFMMGMGG